MGFLSWFTYTYLGARLYGKTDGKKKIPTTSQAEHCPYENQIARIAKENIKRIAQKWDKEDRVLKGKYCDAKRDYQVALAECNKERKEQGLAELGYGTALKTKRSSSEYPHMSPLVYKLLMWFIAIGEMPLTAFVFEIIGENRILTYIFAAVLCISLPMSAHFLGIILREKFEKKRGIIFTTSLLIFLIVLFAIAYMREKFFEGAKVQEILGVSIDPTTITIVFIAIQLFIFWVATMASYFAHDPHINRRKAIKEFNDAKEKVTKEGKEARRAEEKLDKTAELLNKISSLRETTFNEYSNKAGEIKDIHERIIEVYRAYNLRERNDNPDSFKTYPAIEIPDSLQSLNKDCEAGQLDLETEETGDKKGQENSTASEGKI